MKNHKLNEGLYGIGGVAVGLLAGRGLVFVRDGMDSVQREALDVSWFGVIGLCVVFCAVLVGLGMWLSASRKQSEGTDADQGRDQPTGR